MFSSCLRWCYDKVQFKTILTQFLLTFLYVILMFSLILFNAFWLLVKKKIQMKFLTELISFQEL